MPGSASATSGGEDLALIAPTTALPGLGTATPCAGGSPAGTPVLLVTPRRSIRARITGTWQDPDPQFGAYLEIAEALQGGESGGAAFDAASGCLLGLVSHRDEDGGPPRARLVPAATIRRFAGP